MATVSGVYANLTMWRMTTGCKRPEWNELLTSASARSATYPAHLADLMPRATRCQVRGCGGRGLCTRVQKVW